MDTNLLNAFIVVADKKSFSEAAFALYLTQSAVSKRVTQLENVLGTKLFDRLGRRIELTDAGKRFYPRARLIVSEIKDALLAVTDVQGLVSGELSVATSHHIGLHRLPEILKEYKRSYPNVELNLSFMASEAAYDMVVEGKVDLAVATLSQHQHRAVRTTNVWNDPLVCVCGLEHPIADLAVCSAKNLVKHPALLPEKGTITRVIIERWFEEQGLTTTTTMETNYLETLKTMTSVGLGWSVLPEVMVDTSLRIIGIPGLRVHRSLGIVTHKNKTMSPAASAFIQMLKTPPP